MIYPQRCHPPRFRRRARRVRVSALPAKKNQQAMWFTRISIRNPVFATMMMAACLVLGVFSYQRLAVEQFPVVSVPIVIMQTIYGGLRYAGDAYGCGRF